MKILITENQYEKLMYEYLIKIVKDFYTVNNDRDIITWDTKKGKADMAYAISSNFLAISSNLWEYIQNVFMCSDQQIVDLFKEWVYNQDFYENEIRLKFYGMKKEEQYLDKPKRIF